MDLLDLMTGGVDPDERALDRLERILGQYEDEDPAVQDEALDRAQAYCCSHWGSYPAGLEAFARRIEAGADDPVAGSLAAMPWRAEAEESGSMIRAIRRRRAEATGPGAARAAVVARYGSETAARAPTEMERRFIDAAAPLAEPGGGEADPYGPLAGWSLPWHAVPPALREAVVAASPLPAGVADARDEAMAWLARRHELEALGGGPGEAVLPTACAARLRLVEDLWRRDLPPRNATDLVARLHYWVDHGGDDGAGYAVVLRDVETLLAAGAAVAPARVGGRTGDTARRLKAAHPEWSLARIGRELGISRQAVHKHLRKRPEQTP
jgi:hypothetical protein